VVNLLDENVIRSFDVAVTAIEEAIHFGVLYGTEALGEPESVQCAAFPPDGVKVVLSCDDRRLTLYFFGDGRFVFGKSTAGKRVPMGEGELPLSGEGSLPRTELYRWLLNSDAE
jgi:hypothetical protein